MCGPHHPFVHFHSASPSSPALFEPDTCLAHAAAPLCCRQVEMQVQEVEEYAEQLRCKQALYQQRCQQMVEEVTELEGCAAMVGASGGACRGRRRSRSRHCCDGNGCCSAAASTSVLAVAATAAS